MTLLRALGLTGPTPDGTPAPRARKSLIAERSAQAGVNGPPPENATGDAPQNGPDWTPFPNPYALPNITSHGEMVEIAVEAGHADFLAAIPETAENMIWIDGRWQQDHHLLMQWLCRWGTEKLGKQGKKDWIPNPALGGNIGACERTAKQIGKHSLIRTPLSDWDANRYVIGIPNGRCAYVTGTWRDGIYGYGIRDQKPEDLIRTKVPHTPTETWHDSVWERLLQRAVLDPETRDWLKSAAGYALCCTGSAKSVLWFKGPKDSGKTSLLEAIAATIGKARAIVMDGDLLSEGKDNRHRTLLAQLAGKSMAWWAEADGWLNQERLKSLSGGDTQTAHFMRCDPFQFRPDLLMVITSNDDLRIRKRDPALYSRIRLVSCFETIPEEDRDPAAVEIARNGSPEVLAWMLEGAAENKEREDAGHSVLPPDTSEMAAAKRDWLARMNAAEVEDEGEGEASKPRRKRKYTIREPPPETIDAVRRFAAECLQVVAVKEMKGQTPASKEDIHVAFTCWAAENDEPTPSSYGFAGIIEQAVEGASYRVWRAGGKLKKGFNIRLHPAP